MIVKYIYDQNFQQINMALLCHYQLNWWDEIGPPTRKKVNTGDNYITSIILFFDLLIESRYKWCILFKTASKICM